MPIAIDRGGEFNMERIESILDILREMGVEEFECPHFHVRFAQTIQLQAASPAQEVTLADELRKIAPTPESQWHHPSLWNGGAPPKFPTSDK